MTVEINPLGLFGISEPGKPVLQVGRDERVGMTGDLRDLNRIGYGAASQDRPDEKAIHMTLALGNTVMELRDNEARLTTDAPDMYKGHEQIIRELDKFIRHLSLNQQCLFTYNPLTLSAEDGQELQLPQSLRLQATRYNLERLERDIKEAANFQHLSDTRLDRALQYLQLALFEFEEERKMETVTATFDRRDIRDWHIALPFLNLWKALTVIVGDPSRDKDHQRRYRKLGFDHKFYEEKIKPLHDLRNDYDTAHSSLDETVIARVRRYFPEGQQTVIEVIQHYREYLTSLESKSSQP